MHSLPLFSTGPEPLSSDWSASSFDGNYDRTRFSLIVANVAFSLFLLVLALESGWDYSLQSRTASSEALRLFITLSTLALLVQIVESHLYVRRQRLALVHVWRRLSPGLCLELAACSVHLGPTWLFGDHDEFALLMFLRVYWLLRAVFYWSPPYVMRDSVRAALVQSPAYQAYFDESRGVPNVHAVYNLQSIAKATFYYHGVTGISIVGLGASLVFAYCLWISERAYELPDTYSFGVAYWYTVSTMMTVGYAGRHEPLGVAGRSVSMMMCVFGMVYMSLMAVAVVEALRLNRVDQESLQIVQRFVMEKGRGPPAQPEGGRSKATFL